MLSMIVVTTGDFWSMFSSLVFRILLLEGPGSETLALSWLDVDSVGALDRTLSSALVNFELSELANDTGAGVDISSISTISPVVGIAVDSVSAT